ncbi:MAG: response regulator [Ferruginibacter sp.]
MEHNVQPLSFSKTPINILMADDDDDDRGFFQRALKAIPISTQFNEVIDGEKLITYLRSDINELPTILFLDCNMPRKSGIECLLEMQLDERLKLIPVIIYSTSMHEDIANLFYRTGAYYYIKKTNLTDLEFVLNKVLTMILEKTFSRPERANFIMNLSASKNATSNNHLC